MSKSKKREIILFGVLIILIAVFFSINYSNAKESDYTGKAIYDTLSAEQKQAYWDCFKTNKCSELLAAKKNKEYRECSLSCNKQAKTTTENIWCEDSDKGDIFLEKGIVKTNIYSNGKEDSCYTFPNGKTYLFEGRCKNNKYQYVQKNCAELGEDYSCNNGICMQKVTTNTNACVGDKEIVILNIPNSKIDIDLCTHLKDANGIKYYFFKKNPIGFGSNSETTSSFLVILAKEIEGINYRYGNIILELDTVDQPLLYPEASISVIHLLGWDGSLLHLEIQNSCAISYPPFKNKISWCDFKSNIFDKSKVAAKEVSPVWTVVDNELYPDIAMRNEYISLLTTLNKKSYDYLVSALGIVPPVSKIFDVRILQSYSGGSANHFVIYTTLSQISDQSYKEFTIGNTHELVHIFFLETPVKRSWFEEGLAEFMQNSEKGVPNLYCTDKGWYNAYVDENNNIIPFSPNVPYSDFLLYPENAAPFYDPLNKASYYYSAECFWKYIEQTYGAESLKKIAKTWQNSRKLDLSNPEKEYWLIKDIINPVLGTDLSPLVKSRYNYVEE